LRRSERLRLVPAQGDYLNIGLGREGHQGLAEQLEDFCDFLRERGRIPATYRQIPGHAYLLRGRSQRRLVDDGVLLIGDAAGLAYPQSGEGIRPAVESGLIAAAVIAQPAGITLSAPAGLPRPAKRASRSRGGCGRRHGSGFLRKLLAGRCWAAAGRPAAWCSTAVPARAPAAVAAGRRGVPRAGLSRQGARPSG